MVRRLFVCLIPTVCNQQQWNLNDCVKWLISSIRSVFIHPSRLEQLVITMPLFFYTILFFFHMHFWHRNIWLSSSLTADEFLEQASWSGLFFSPPIPPQVDAPVKYAWQRNEWHRLLRKCWCFMRNFCGCDLQVCFIFALMLHLLRFRAASRWGTFCTKWRQLWRSGCLVCSQLAVIQCTSFK